MRAEEWQRSVLLMAATPDCLRVLPARASDADFDAELKSRGIGPLTRQSTTTLQINVGKLCNQACHHCHVDAGPRRTEIMPEFVADRLLRLLRVSPSIGTVDITGGAPELNPSFRRVVKRARQLGREVIDRCNLTVFFEEGMEGLPTFLATHQVQVVASLPCYTAENVDQQRGRGVFDKSVEALRWLNRLGYGLRDPGLQLHLVYNPLGPFLPPPQQKLEQDYRRELRERFGIEFTRLLTITNMPISRFADALRRQGKYESYLQLLVDNFNPATVGEVMCRSLVSVGWDGRLHDCDFNQMLDLPLGTRNSARTIWDLENFDELTAGRIATGSHCFGCTAGTGSSCGGSLQ